MRILNPAEELRSSSPELTLPPEFAGEVDVLRLDALQHTVPPPFKYFPLSVPGHDAPPALMTCSLSGAIEVLLKYDLFLIRLTGPYALFVRRGEWPNARKFSRKLHCLSALFFWLPGPCWS
ncbi:ergic3 [Symbiodinium natans]|uniref:Ergic3 protein n=1 Tax=Symbiodinium natans TaxID=878477 RepID=A0A812MJS4_9DINO|nr:ergic3 [Symbiodinium natans]